MPEGSADEDADDSTPEGDPASDWTNCPMVADLFRSRSESLPDESE